MLKMDDNIARFQNFHPSLETNWRSVILFGQNSASYKFALAESLIDLSSSGKTNVTLEELAIPYSNHLCEHLKNAPKQVTNPSSKFVEACVQYNNNEISKDQLISTTVKYGFNNVIGAFHKVNGADIPNRFYETDYSHSSKRIILSDNTFKLMESSESNSFIHEAEARWKLVETAWALRISRNLLDVKYDVDKELFFVNINRDSKRRNVTSARSALNGYQKGKCFYCHASIIVSNDKSNTCDVDHYFPHVLKNDPQTRNVNIDGIWNLVLTCTNCNRGINGKSDNAPATKYLNELHTRNEFLISSHHPLSETIKAQTGSTPNARWTFLQDMDRIADCLNTRWETNVVGEAVL